MASSSKTRYGWQFPDGTVIPVDEKYKVKDKLLESDRFLGKLSNDELRGGNLYSEAYNLDLEYLVEDGYDNPDYFMEMYGVTIVDRGGKYSAAPMPSIGAAAKETLFSLSSMIDRIPRKQQKLREKILHMQQRITTALDMDD